jgi:hypothetical protein
MAPSAAAGVLRRRRAERVHQERRDGHAGLERLDEHLLRG